MTQRVILALCIVLTACGSGNVQTTSPSGEKTLTAYVFINPAATGIIDQSAKTISVTVPQGTNVTSLVAAFTTTGAIVKVGSAIQVSGSSTNDFTNAVAYTVTAEDGTSSDYTVRVTMANYVHLQSDPGDYIGSGQTYTYTQANAQIGITAAGGLLTISISGNQNWTGNFQVPNSFTQLVAGSYGNLTRYPFNDPTIGGLSWYGEGRGCNTLTGRFIIDKVSYSNGSITEIDLRFEQHCEGAVAALRGQIHWTPNDITVPPGPVVPPPAGLWQPVSGATPTSGNYVYLQSDPGDYIGAGLTYTYTQANAQIGVTSSGGLLTMNISGNQNWTGNFKAMNTLGQLEPGYYGGLKRYPFNNPVLGGLSWYGEGRGCNTLTGWFVIDNITYNNGNIEAVDLRFEQHCEGVSAALRGQIHWTPIDTTAPPGPINPPPEGLWQPVSGATPATGNYVYLQSDPGDFIGAGQTYTYTQATAQVGVTSSGGLLTINITGSQYWTGNFRTMNTLGQLEPGYYGGLKRYPFNNPVLGGLAWYGEGRGCNNLTGWFVIDDITYNNGNIAGIDLRFEQHCEGLSPALHGQIHWIL